MVGMLIGRSKVFLYSEENIKLWTNVFIIATFAFSRFMVWQLYFPTLLVRRHCLFLLLFCLSRFPILHLQEYCLQGSYLFITSQSVEVYCINCSLRTHESYKLSFAVFDRWILVLQLGIRTLPLYRHYGLCSYGYRYVLFAIPFVVGGFVLIVRARQNGYGKRQPGLTLEKNKKTPGLYRPGVFDYAYFQSGF